MIRILAALARAGSCRYVVVLSSRNWQMLTGMDLLRQRVKLALVAAWYSRRKNLHVHLSEDINTDSYFDRVGSGDAGVVIGFDQIFRAGLIERFGSLVNFHWSLLPYYRGPIPTYWCLANNETRTGITVHKVNEEIDRGEIIHQLLVNIEPGEDEWALRCRMWRLAAPVFKQWLLHLTEGRPFERQRVDAGAEYRTHVDYLSYPHRTDSRL